MSAGNQAEGPAEQNKRFVGLQIYRGFAALLVLFFHSTGIAIEKFDAVFLGNVFKMGNAGVDFFFVLSGFLITYIHRKDIGKRERFRKYFFKRTIRVFPVYWLITLLILPVYFLNSKYGQGDETHLDVILKSLFLVPMHRAPILVAGWTLNYETLFYTIFGLLIIFGFKWLRYVLVLWTIALIYTCITNYDNTIVYAHPFIKLILFPQNLEFLLGCLAAYLATKQSVRSIPRLFFYLLVGLLSIAFMMMGLLPDDFADLSRGKHTIVYSLLSFGIVLGLSQFNELDHEPVNRSSFSILAALSLLGDASFSLYLLHGPCISLLFKLMQSTKGYLPMNLIVFFVVSITITVSIIFHIVIEKRLLSYFRMKFL